MRAQEAWLRACALSCFVCAVSFPHCISQHSFFFLLNYLCILAALGLCCFVWAFSSYSEQRQLFLGVHGLLTVVISLVVERSL